MPDLSHESCYWQQGMLSVAGVDEAGRGPLAGPVVAAAVILPPEAMDIPALQGLNDSKQLSASRREVLYSAILQHATDWSIGVVSSHLIDRLNILQATFLAMFRALRGLEKVDACLIDGNQSLPFWQGIQQALIKGDQRSLSIAAASVLAKVTRDRILLALDEIWSDYGLAKHKGYPTTEHIRRIRVQGLTSQHRFSFCHKLLEATP